MSIFLNFFYNNKNVIDYFFFLQLNLQIFGIKRSKSRINVRESIRDVKVR